MSVATNTIERPFLSILLILIANILLGIGAYAVAWQFNDGKAPAIMLGASLLVMVPPNMIIGFACKLAGYPIANYFKYMAIVAFFAAMAVFFLFI